jgi:RNA recognition motif-containing protein
MSHTSFCRNNIF